MFANRRSGDDLNRPIHRLDHCCENSELLKILLPEDGHIRRDDMKQFCDDLTDAAKMPWSVFAVQDDAQLRQINRDIRHAGRIHFLGGGQEDQINPRLLTFFQV